MTIDATQVLLAIIGGIITIYLARMNSKVNDVQSQVQPPPTPANMPDKTLGEHLSEMRDDIAGLTDMFGRHISDGHGPNLFDRRQRNNPK